MGKKFIYCFLPDRKFDFCFITPEPVLRINPGLVEKWFPKGMDARLEINYSEVFPVASCSPQLGEKVMKNGCAARIICDHIKEKFKS